MPLSDWTETKETPLTATTLKPWNARQWRWYLRAHRLDLFSPFQMERILGLAGLCLLDMLNSGAVRQIFEGQCDYYVFRDDVEVQKVAALMREDA